MTNIKLVVERNALHEPTHSVHVQSVQRNKKPCTNRYGKFVASARRATEAVNYAGLSALRRIRLDFLAKLQPLRPPLLAFTHFPFPVDNVSSQQRIGGGKDTQSSQEFNIARFLLLRCSIPKPIDCFALFLAGSITRDCSQLSWTKFQGRHGVSDAKLTAVHQIWLVFISRLGPNLMNTSSSRCSERAALKYHYCDERPKPLPLDIGYCSHETRIRGILSIRNQSHLDLC